MSPAEALDRFTRGLKPYIRKDVLVQGPTTFEDAAIIADRIASTGKFPGASAGSSSYQPRSTGYAPMELGSMQGGYDRRGGRRGGAEGRQAGRGGSRQGCFICGQEGHWKRECPRRGSANVARADQRAEHKEEPKNERMGQR